MFVDLNGAAVLQLNLQRQQQDGCRLASDVSSDSDSDSDSDSACNSCRDRNKLDCGVPSSINLLAGMCLPLLAGMRGWCADDSTRCASSVV
jgi:hypothetical protein